MRTLFALLLRRRSSSQAGGTFLVGYFCAGMEA